MKVSIFPILLSSAAVLFIAAGCKTTSTTERPQLCTVTSLSGTARYWGANSNEMRELKVGDRIPQGSTIQTLFGTGNYVDLATGRRRLLSQPGSGATYDPKDEVRIFENTILKL